MGRRDTNSCILIILIEWKLLEIHFSLLFFRPYDRHPDGSPGDQYYDGPMNSGPHPPADNYNYDSYQKYYQGGRPREPEYHGTPPHGPPMPRFVEKLLTLIYHGLFALICLVSMILTRIIVKIHMDHLMVNHLKCEEIIMLDPHHHWHL